MKILHVGNIANNGYLNSKILNNNDIESDIICCDYYHIMGCPEWEDADFVGDYGDDNSPNWTKVDLNGFNRSDWFIQGRKLTVLKYLISKNEGSNFKSIWYYFLLKNERLLYQENYKFFFKPLLVFYRKGVSFLHYSISNTRVLKNKILEMNKFLLVLISPLLFVSAFLLLPLKVLYVIYKKYTNRIINVKITDFDKRINELKSKFSEDLKEKSKYFNESYLLTFKSEYFLWKNLFSHYDIIIGYGVDGIYPLLAGKKYIAFEHGTLRNLPFQNDELGLRTLLSYKYANGVIITNADNIKSAIKLKNYKFIPHPINEAPLELLDSCDYDNLYEKYDTDFIVFHPSRQHWEKDVRHPDWEKGNDIFIEGFAKFVHNVNKNAKSIFIDWGQKVNESKELIRSLGIENNVVWIKPMHNYAMIRTILSTDLVADQFYLGAFGSTTPKALMCGKPAMLYLDESLHKWCFDEMPPVLNTKNDDDVYNLLSKTYNDKQFLMQLSNNSKEWYLKYHSNDLIRNRILELVDIVMKDSINEY